jgi:hypothetical protein
LFSFPSPTDLDKSPIGRLDTAENLLDHSILGVLRANLERVGQQPLRVHVPRILAHFEIQRFNGSGGVQLQQLKLNLIEPIGQMPQLPNDLTAQKPQLPNHRNASIKRLQDRFHGKSLSICNAVAGRIGPHYPTAAVILHPKDA